MGVKYISEINAFHNWLETHHITPSAQLMWFKLIHLFNISKWDTWITIPNDKLSLIAGTTLKTTILARDELVTAGLLEYKKGFKRHPNKYKMIFFADQEELQCKNSTVFEDNEEIPCNNYTETDENGKIQCNHSTINGSINGSLYKDKDKKNNIYINSFESKKPRFTPPTVENVSDYCKERNNGIDAEAFVDHYTSKGWFIGKSPMKDWKAAVRTWEKRNKSNSVNGSELKYFE